MTPREQAIDKLAHIMLNAYNKYHSVDGGSPYAPDFLKNSCFYPQAEAILDALGVEVVDRDTKLLPCPFCGDNPSRFLAEQGNEVRCQKCQFSIHGDAWRDSLDIWNTRNTTIYVENIKEKENVS
jgi:ribosomal protein L37AE/L43A